jgi:hypothetical protein
LAFNAVGSFYENEFWAHGGGIDLSTRGKELEELAASGVDEALLESCPFTALTFVHRPNDALRLNRAVRAVHCLDQP